MKKNETKDLSQTKGQLMHFAVFIEGTLGCVVHPAHMSDHGGSSLGKQHVIYNYGIQIVFHIYCHFEIEIWLDNGIFINLWTL